MQYSTYLFIPFYYLHYRSVLLPASHYFSSSHQYKKYSQAYQFTVAQSVWLETTIFVDPNDRHDDMISQIDLQEIRSPREVLETFVEVVLPVAPPVISTPALVVAFIFKSPSSNVGTSDWSRIRYLIDLSGSRGVF